MLMDEQIKACSLSKGEIYTQLCLETERRAYTSYLRGARCTTEDAFFNEISASFQFPYYYGENWPATDECLCDLEWLNPTRIFVVVDDFSCMFSEQEYIQKLLQDRVVKYFEVMVKYWKGQGIPVEIWLNN